MVEADAAIRLPQHGLQLGRHVMVLIRVCPYPCAEAHRPILLNRGP